MTLASPLPSGPATARVLIADDSAVVRGMVRRWLEAERGIEIVGAAADGRQAVDLAAVRKPAVIVLDVEMPHLDGVAAIPELLRAAPGVRILMSSTLTQRNAEISLKAMAAGAADYLAKPEAGKLGGAEAFRAELVAKVRALAGAAARRASAPPAAAAPQRPVARPRTGPAQAVVIGCSTGGPHALDRVLPALAGKLPAPILVVQHMPAMFTAMLAEHLRRTLGADLASEAAAGERLLPGRVYIAPGDHHLRIERRGGVLMAVLGTDPPVNFCRPAVDPLFISAASTLGADVVAAVLTGMGHDGRAGAQALTAAGAVVVAQDEGTSVVWGMPGAVVGAGCATAVKPLEEIGPAIHAFAQGTQR